MNVEFELHEKVAALSDAIMSRHPTMKTLLREIHSTVKQYPEQVTLLSEEEIGVIVNGLKTQTGVELVTKKTSTSKVAKLKSLGSDAY